MKNTGNRQLKSMDTLELIWLKFVEIRRWNLRCVVCRDVNSMLNGLQILLILTLFYFNLKSQQFYYQLDILFDSCCCSNICERGCVFLCVMSGHQILPAKCVCQCVRQHSFRLHVYELADSEIECWCHSNARISDKQTAKQDENDQITHEFNSFASYRNWITQWVIFFFVRLWNGF